MAARCARIWWVRPVSSRTSSSVVRGSASSTSKCVTAVRALSVEVDIAVRRARSRPSGASMVPAARVRSALHQGEVAPLHLAPADHRASAPRGPPLTSPRASARRCRGPGGARCRRAQGPAPPAALPFRAWASVPAAPAGAGMHHHARGLVDHHQRSRPRARRRTAPRAASVVRLLGQLGRARPALRPPGGATWAARSPSTVTAPRIDQPLGLRARRGLPARGQRRVEAHAGLGGPGPEAHSRRPSTT